MKQNISHAPNETKDLYKSALLAREHAYCPYSGYKVGAAIRTVDGKIFAGCNVENSSYGGTACAEQVAIQKAVSEVGKIQIAEILVITHADNPWPPCGLCRQVIAEFSDPTTKIYTANLEGTYFSFSFPEIVPQAFTPNHLVQHE